MIAAARILVAHTPLRPLRNIGFAATAAGWFVIIATVVARIAGAHFAAADVAIAACLAIALLLCGASLLVLDALRTGFGALDSFFREALARSARRAAEAAPHATAPRPDAVQRRGYIGERPYVLYANGSVVVETLLGARRFASLQEAGEFVGA